MSWWGWLLTAIGVVGLIAILVGAVLVNAIFKSITDD